ncbi:hypothetical protein GALMADRAFT_204710 [Galerina marginata CBS 339.88]|uniref:Uncharacterized protein n=1 Tax=Galerina marginata (strain CBS 339.88) TaxID=685588 RepID=A0A067TS60_GALM3|nr:hypothetical protein GALMADRAFT_204710 [Galerina marginata CBS 339.88]
MASPEVPFTPRKEFIKELPIQPNSFALLALSSANCIRLYSFSSVAVASLRRLFEQYSHILSFREDSVQNLYEFALDAKPWANPKSVPTEKLLVNIISVIYQCGYTYLSTIDYGRENDDRLAMTFSRPSVALVNSRAGEKPKVNRVPFAISFSSVTVMRVISPPLHLTPAILQAVRGSWPRGVVAEKKVGDNSYEFKLKGYKYSLRHILSLLSSLDSHSFSLLTSISLTNRSRVKDLWIFTGPAPESASLPIPPEQFLPEETSVTSPSPPMGSFAGLHLSPNQHQHRRLATDPISPTPHSPVVQHARAATESPQRPLLPSPQPQVLRKPAPRAQVPVSVVQDSDIPDESHPLRAHMPSTISAGVENMTGVGASPNIFYSTSPFDAAVAHLDDSGQISDPISPRPGKGSPSDHGRPPLRPVSDRAKTPPLLVSSSAPPSPTKPFMPPVHDQFQSRGDLNLASPPLLGIGTFRDSAFSSTSDMSYEIPIKWTGPLKDETRAKSSRVSSSPNFPGGWQPTPIAEKSEDETQNSPSDEKKNNTTPIHEIGSRFDAPEVIKPDMPLRKSEAALVGIIHSTSPAPPVPRREKSEVREAQTPSNGGQGWVLVNVDNASSPGPAEGHDGVRSDVSSTQLPGPLLNGVAKSDATPSPPVEQPSSAAKAIVIIDAMDSKHKKSRSTSGPKQTGEGSSGVRRFFSLNRKSSKKALDDDEKVAPKSIPRSNLRDRLRLIGMPEASRKEDKRRSID